MEGRLRAWKGGLGVWGGIFFGCVAGWIVVRRSGRSAAVLADCAAPGLLLAQGIGRIGNWFNQELYGKPTDSAWGLEIDPEHRVAGYEQYDTFHPTFLYELLYDLTMVGVLLLIDWRFRIKPPALFSLYVAFYTFGRFFEELLRIDPAHELAGLRLNAWVSLILLSARALLRLVAVLPGGRGARGSWPPCAGRAEDGDSETAEQVVIGAGSPSRQFGRPRGQSPCGLDWAPQAAPQGRRVRPGN